MRLERLRRRTGHGRGQSMTELAMLLPILAFLLLAVVDFAHVHSVQQRLENGTHLAASKLLANPSVPLAAGIAAEARLPSSAVTATTSYTADLNGDNHVTLSDCGLSSGTGTYCLKIAPSTGSATPSGLRSLVCTVYRGVSGNVTP